MPELRTVSVVDALASAIRNAILAVELIPGERIAEVEIARRFGAARPSVRAALQELVREGTLRREPNRSVYVPKLGAGDVRDLFGVRAMVEVEAVRRLVSGRVVPSAAVRALRVLEALRADDPWGDVVAADLDLHRALVDGVGSARMSRIYASICDEVRLSIVQLRPAYGSPEELAGEHRELLGAISSGPVAAAVTAMRKHLDAALDVLTRAADAEVADAS